MFGIWHLNHKLQDKDLYIYYLCKPFLENSRCSLHIQVCILYMDLHNNQEYMSKLQHYFFLYKLCLLRMVKDCMVRKAHLWELRNLQKDWNDYFIVT